MTISRILLCFSDTGGGHRSATDAIEAAIREILCTVGIDQQVELLSENVAEKTHPINRMFVELYNFLLRHSQMSMKYYYSLIHWLKPNDSWLGYMLSGPFLRQLLLDIEPAVVVSVHPMLNQYFARAIRDCGQTGQTKLVTVVTDPNEMLWKGWACPEADLTIVPNHLVQARLMSWGVPETKIRAIGMPIDPDFIKPPLLSREEFIGALGLAPNCLTVCLNAGWAGGGNMMAIYRSLAAFNKPVQAIFLCGHNQELYKKVLRRTALSSIPTAVLPFHDRMSDLMGAIDLMVTKAGGLTTFEAIARSLPMAIDMITEPMPQEQGTIDLLLEAGLATTIKKPDDILSVLEQLEANIRDKSETRTRTKPIPALQNLNRINAVYEIAKEILDCASMQSSDDSLTKSLLKYGRNGLVKDLANDVASSPTSEPRKN